METDALTLERMFGLQEIQLMWKMRPQVLKEGQVRYTKRITSMCLRAQGRNRKQNRRNAMLHSAFMEVDKQFMTATK